MRHLMPTAFAIVLVAIAVGGCSWSESGQALKGSGTVVDESRTVTGFTAVDLQGIGVLRLSQGTAESLTVRTDDNLQPLITTRVRDETLVMAIDTRDHPHGIAPTTLVYDLTVTSLEALSVSGAARVEGGSLSTGDLRLDIDGAARIVFDDLRAETLHVSSDGNSAFTLSGAVDAQEINIAGAGEYQAKALASRTADIRISGAGHVAIQVAESLDASIDGTGVIEYAGSPTVDQHITGLGVVRHVES